MSNLAVAKVFKNGRSQAVRLPKEFRFDTEEVTVERLSDDAVVLRRLPNDAHAAWVARVLAAVSRFEGMPEEIERDKTPPRDVPSWD
jgi:antitoxin VapB